MLRVITALVLALALPAAATANPRRAIVLHAGDDARLSASNVTCHVSRFSGPLLVLTCGPSTPGTTQLKLGGYTVSLTDLGVNVGRVGAGFSFHPVWNRARPKPYVVGRLAPNTASPPAPIVIRPTDIVFLAKMDIVCVATSSQLQCGLEGENARLIPRTLGFSLDERQLTVYSVTATGSQRVVFTRSQPR